MLFWLRLPQINIPDKDNDSDDDNEDLSKYFYDIDKSDVIENKKDIKNKNDFLEKNVVKTFIFRIPT